MSTTFDHVVHVVQDLPQATKDFQDQGFTVTPGGVHFRGVSENNLIFFKDGTFIELLTLRKSFNAKMLRMLHRTKLFKKWQYSAKYGVAYRFYNRAIEQPDGLTDFCLLVDDPSANYERIQQAGVFLTDMLHAGRKKTDGSIVSWQMFAPYIADLPFLRSDYVPKAELPSSATDHANGIMGISAIHQLALDFKDSLSKYVSLLGAAPSFSDSKMGIFTNGEFHYKIYRASTNPDIQKQLSGKGIGLYGISFSAPSQPILDVTKLHGLQVINS
jgi:hypothetical protein